MNLVHHSKMFSHIVFSLNRRLFKFFSCTKSEKVYAASIWGMPYGIFLRSFLEHAAKNLVRIIEEENLMVDLIHAHKLTFEGIVAYYISQRLDIPFVCTIRGNTDVTVIRYKRGYRSLYREILTQSGRNFVVAPWTIAKVESLLSLCSFDRWVLLPNIVPVTRLPTASATTSNRFVSVFHLRNYKNKNIFGVLKAIRILKDRGTEIFLDIIGGGGEQSKIEKYAKQLQISDHVRFLGSKTNSEISQLCPDYAGLVLPSFRETFGFVFLEALNAGIPIIYSRNTAIDGYFDEYAVAIKVNPEVPGEIARAMESVALNQENFRKEIQKMFSSGFMDRFNSSNIISVYESNVSTVLS